MSVATKVAIQIAAKLGAEPWGVKIPMKNTMVVGYDSYHDSSQKGLAVGAVVATMNSDLTRFSSSTTLHRNNDELISQMQACFTNAIVRYKKYNSQVSPQRIFIYRDGLGEGQIDYALNTEITALQEVMKLQGLENVQFAYIIVSKRINARFFQMTGTKPMNPPSGSVLDDVVTLPERHDFYLVSQSVRQGTVNPTSYNIIINTSPHSVAYLQALSSVLQLARNGACSSSLSICPQVSVSGWKLYSQKNAFRSRRTSLLPLIATYRIILNTVLVM